MKAVVQRVTRGSVSVGGREVSAIGRGLCVLLGIARADTFREAEWMARKILNLRLFENPSNGKAWDKSVSDLGLEVLCVSQFTLCHVLKGNKPDFHNAMNAETSRPMYEDFLKLLGSLYKPEAIKGGEFGAMMQVCIQNDGPVTLQFETPQLPPLKERKLLQNLGRKGSGDTRKESVDSQRASDQGQTSGDTRRESVDSQRASDQGQTSGDTRRESVDSQRASDQGQTSGDTRRESVDSQRASDQGQTSGDTRRESVDSQRASDQGQTSGDTKRESVDSQRASDQGQTSGDTRRESVDSQRASDQGQSSRETVTTGVRGLSLEQKSNLEQQP